MDKIFEPKIDKAVILRSILMLIPLPLLVFIAGKWNTEIVIGIFIIQLILLIPFGIILPLRTTYRVTTNGVLIVPAGVRRIKINIKDITSVKPGHSLNDFLLNSYVNSLDQLKLFYKKSSAITISPIEKAAFIRALQNQNIYIKAE